MTTTAPPFSSHVLQRTIVLPEQRVLYVPVPKAGCTSVLWALAGLAGIPVETFAESAQAEVSAALTVHDMSLWGTGRRLADFDGEQRELILGEEGWLRFTLVRDPATRLFSAWQSKLLLREPRFVDAFGEAPWFPRVPERPEDIVEDFRAFVAALGGDEPPEDVHWAVQHDLVSLLPLDHVGRVERLSETLDLLRAHVSAPAPHSEPPRENRSALAMPPGAYGDVGAEVLATRYRSDFDVFAYEPDLRDGDAGAWHARAAELLPGIRETIDRHGRIGQLHRVARRHASRLERAERRLEDIRLRQVGPARAPILRNLEGDGRYDVRWGWADGDVAAGFTAVVRVRNERTSLPWVLPPLLRAVERVVVVDNGSTDGTAEVARAVAAREGAADRLDVHRYPFDVARCGAEHLSTPAASVHSLAHFYNWSFAHVRTSYALKWDGDMVLTDAAADALRQLAWQLEAAEAVVRVPRHTLYIAGDDLGFIDLSLRNCEPWGWPNRPGYSFAKALEWELPLWPRHVETITLPEWSCVELKQLDADEFAHWSPTDFGASPRTRRKQRELEVFRALTGGGDPPSGVVPVHAPAGEHVVDHVRTSWLPAR